MESVASWAFVASLVIIGTSPVWAGAYIWRLERKWRRDGTWAKLIELKKKGLL